MVIGRQLSVYFSSSVEASCCDKGVKFRHFYHCINGVVMGASQNQSYCQDLVQHHRALKI